MERVSHTASVCVHLVGPVSVLYMRYGTQRIHGKGKSYSISVHSFSGTSQFAFYEIWDSEDSWKG